MIEVAILRRKIQLEKSFAVLIQNLNKIGENLMINFKVKTHANYVPFSSFFLPKDKITIFKSGNKFRVNFSLNKIKGSSVEYRDSSIIYNPQFPRLEGESQVKILRHDKKTFKNLLVRIKIFSIFNFFNYFNFFLG